jgi:hypothetical protein
MQIHEITRSQLDEGFASDVGTAVGDLAGQASAKISRGVQAVSSPWQAAKAAFKRPVQNQQIALLVNKAFPIWQNFAERLRASIKDPAKLQAFDNRTDGVYEKNLLAFTQKNLLGGAYLPNLTNKQEILDLVHALSAPKVQRPIQEARQIVKPGALSSRAQARNAPATTAPATTAPATTAPATTAPATTAPATTAPATTAPAATSLSPAQEKELFTQLVSQGTLAQNTAQGVGADTDTSTSAKMSKKKGANPGSARGIYRDLVAVLNKKVGVKPETLKNIGSVAFQGFNADGSPRVTSTGNQAADALLLAMGFTGL